MSVKAAGFIFLGLLAAISPARAQSEQAEQMEKSFSLTISPFHLAMPVLELTAEKAVSPKLGIAGIAGFGSVPVENNLGEKKSIPILELGGQLDYYVVGSFRHGMQVGAEAVWIKVFIPDDEGVVVSANGIAVGPLLGYKWAARFGLTFMVQGGYQCCSRRRRVRMRRGTKSNRPRIRGFP